MAEIREQIFWLESVGEETRPTSPLPERVDVAIVGAGFAGLSAARTLALHGANVAVLESETVGFGASSRNGGMVLPGLKRGVSDLVRRYGKETAQRMYAASTDSIDWVEKVVQEEEIACDFHRHGHLSLAAKPAHYQSFQRSAEILEREFKHPVRLVPQERLSDEIGSHAYFGGIVDSCSAGVNPALYVRGLAKAAERAGAKIYEHSAVTSFQKRSQNGSSGWELALSDGRRLFAGKVLLASGAYGPRNYPFIPKKIVPLGSYIIVTEVLPEDVAKRLIPHGRMIYDSLNFLHYFRLTPDRRMLFGGRAAFFPASDSTVRSSAEILRRGMVQIYPELKNTKVEWVWGGTLDVTFDMMPHTGCKDGMYYSIGYAGHGVALASYIGHRLGEKMAGKTWDDPFEIIDFPGAPLGLYDGRPWFLPAVGVWFKIMDWIQ